MWLFCIIYFMWNGWGFVVLFLGLIMIFVCVLGLLSVLNVVVMLGKLIVLVISGVVLILLLVSMCNVLWNFNGV